MISESKIESVAATGLTRHEAAERLKSSGANEITVAPSLPAWRMFLRQFESALIALLIVGAVIAGMMGEFVDAVAILTIVVLNAVLGFVQEWRAERALEALKSILSPEAVVLRDGIQTHVPAREVVPGDILLLDSGAKIAADAIVLVGTELRVDESILTGESQSVAKCSTASTEIDNADQLFMGTNVVHGHAKALVTETGLRTKFGRIAELTTAVPPPTTHLQKTLGKLGRHLASLAIVVVACVLAIGWWTGRDLGEMALTGISLAVAVVPEGLPAVVTVTLALGARAMVRRNALSRRLQAVETLGSADIICTDKTGTLTENQMTVTRICTPEASYTVSGTGYEPAGRITAADGNGGDSAPLALLTTAMTCNHAFVTEGKQGWNRTGEPTEAALVTAAMKAGLTTSLRDAVVREIPFSSVRKRMSVVVEEPTGNVLHLKGAPEFVFPLCRSVPDGTMTAYAELTAGGLRVLAFARRDHVDMRSTDNDLEQNLTFLGLIGILDPPRAEVMDALGTARSAGIRTIMITGDAAETALSIASAVGLPARRAVEGSQLAGLSDSELDTCLQQDIVFARTAPEHKMRIIERLQAAGHVVAMTGDGVNDAPALKKADIGIAMGIRGTDVARDASDLVLLDDNFATIIAAIEEGRRQYENVKKFVRYLLCSNGGEVVAIVANLFIGGPLIFQPIQILWMNLVTDGPTALTLGIEPTESDTMQRDPRPRDEALIGVSGIATIAAFSAYTGSASLWVFYNALEHGALYAQTMAFTTMVLLEKFSVFTFRSLRLPLLKIGLFSNQWLLFAVAGTVLLHVAAIYWQPLQIVLHTMPLDANDWILIAAVVLPVVIVPEIGKWFLAALTQRN